MTNALWRDTFRIQGILAARPDLRKKAHPHPLGEHCYVACEALYHYSARQWGFRPFHVKHEGTIHWFLRSDFVGGGVSDPTAQQFKTLVNYSDGIGCGFLTKQPSRRAQVVLDILNNMQWS